MSNNFIKYHFSWKKQFLLLFSILSLSSCIQSGRNNSEIEQLKNGDLAAVVGGCNNYKKALFGNVTKQKCVATWENEEGEKFSINGDNDIKFIKPGNYTFVAYQSKTRPILSYTKYADSIPIFNEISIKGGEVLYIGHLNVDLSKLEAKAGHMMDFINLPKQEKSAADYLRAKHPSLANKMQLRPLTFSSEAQLTKKLLNLMHNNKKGN